MNIVEQAKVVQVQVPVDRTGAAMTTEWISMKNAEKCTFILQTGVMTSTSAQAVTLAVADDASGTHNAAITGAGVDLTLPHYWVKTVSTDTYTKTTVASSTFNIVTTDDNKIFIIEVNANNMGRFLATSVYYDADYVRLSVATPGAHACRGVRSTRSATSCITRRTCWRRSWR